ncbi:5-methyltetrahydropteroyltriglutamate--homocysteine S-methyltransferase [Acaryochloris marina]|uniref:5-methyltetrahydropteroyltriglutamate--homocysteine methyltransferase n=1 Tax=Acaryochloris marina (strain MBIC 11017) TaxID=329726 RepID=A8ZQ25_ACAM1|nr:5-methyltetrahydropteroyltriglutamate--homocysteine S-methyltransferase [Acaryochloris marina]ABW33140.1 5-methyltetrahydropteroyltriglutamate--homocysteine S-methyltransferase [Acaryochloris marina MBIC11017]
MSQCNKSPIKTHSLGYPRIGAKRELKKATEAYWKGDLPLSELLVTGKTLRETNWKKQQAAGLDLIPVNDFSFYDQVLDMSCLLGNVPPRFQWQGGQTDINTAFTIARGTEGGTSWVEDEKDCQTSKVSTFASEMTKWFDTNYHYIVPEFRGDTTFSLSSTKVFDELAEAKELGINAKPVLVGPVTYLSLGKVQGSNNPDFDPLTLLDNLVSVYVEILDKLAAEGAEWIQLDEPIISTDLSNLQREALKVAYDRLSKVQGSAKLLVTTYFGGVRDNLDDYLALPVDALHFDFVRGSEDIDSVLDTFPTNKILSVGIVEGRNVWKNDYDASLEFLKKAKVVVGADRLWVAPSCSLLHSPVTLQNEQKLDDELKSWLAFADEKLTEVTELRQLLDEVGSEEMLETNRAAVASRKSSKRIHNDAVKKRLAGVKPSDFDRASAFVERQTKQRAKLRLPEFPTTTIGSFPQTKEVRLARAQWKKGKLSDADYDQFMKEEIAKCVAFQDEIGIDMPVHGEFERNDMVEYFGENLEGFTFTSTGWVQSFGTRYVKPPIIFGDVSRSKPMTVYWSEYAQSLTDRPMKGMLTGPVTILQWSFVRDDQPRSVTTHQIALAIRDEVVDLEAAGIAAIQIDEPAFREGLPLRRSEWDNYLNWAVKAFHLSACGVEDETQIHTHMCYSEFNDIIDSIAAMDADVITIETSRSNMELLDAFVDFKYPNEIGPGVYDIHSPRVPPTDEMSNLMSKAEAVLPREHLWVNPDCGLKTRQWSEVKPSLINMVETASKLRATNC